MMGANDGQVQRGARGSRGSGSRSGKATGLTVRSGGALVYGCTIEQARELAWPQGVQQQASHYVHAAQKTKLLADEVQLLLGRGSLRDGVFFGRTWLKESEGLLAWLNRLNDADSWLRHFDQVKVEGKLRQLKEAVGGVESLEAVSSERSEDQDSLDGLGFWCSNGMLEGAALRSKVDDPSMAGCGSGSKGWESKGESEDGEIAGFSWKRAFFKG